MVTRADLLMLGITSSVSGGLIAGLLFGIGLGEMIAGVHMGLLLIVVAAPLSASVGWFMGRRLARQLD